MFKDNNNDPKIEKFRSGRAGSEEVLRTTAEWMGRQLELARYNENVGMAADNPEIVREYQARTVEATVVADKTNEQVTKPQTDGDDATINLRAEESFVEPEYIEAADTEAEVAQFNSERDIVQAAEEAPVQYQFTHVGPVLEQGVDNGVAAEYDVRRYEDALAAVEAAQAFTPVQEAK